MVSNSAALILATGIVLAALALSSAFSRSADNPTPAPVVQPLSNGRVFIFYLNTMLSCDADTCKRVGHMFDPDLAAKK